MYEKLSNKSDLVKKILEFNIEIATPTNNFHKFALHLINKYFGYEKMMFFPYHQKFYAKFGKTKEDVFFKYVTLNMTHESIEAYSKHIRHIDIFSTKRLSKELLDRKVLFTSDVIGREEYLQSEYYERMHALRLEQQACIILKENSESIAAIVIFRSQDEEAFSETDYYLMEYLSDLVSRQYSLSKSVSKENIISTAFDMFFKSSQVGAIVINHRLSVVLANESAQSIGDHFMDDFKNVGWNFLNNNYQSKRRYQRLQEMVDAIGLDLINSVKGKEFASAYMDYIFTSSPFLFLDTSGDVEIYNLIFIYARKKKLNSVTEEAFEQLTTREKEILGYILNGMDNEEIAAHAHISVYTVRTHISNIYQKFNVNSKAGLLLLLKNH